MWYVVGGVCLGLGAFLVAGLLVQRARLRRAEDGLRASRQEQQRLAGRLIEAQEDERRRVARELHDDLSQRLALLSVGLDVLARQPPRTAGETAVQLRGLAARVRELSSAVHALSHMLHPAKLEQLGLVAAVRGLCAEFNRSHGLRVHFTHAGVPGALPDPVALGLYRIVQEALRNVVRRSGIDRATVELTGTTAAIHLVVSDDGAGFDPASALRNGGLGLVSMRERLHLAGGALTIDARPEGGTRIHARVPAPCLAWQEGTPDGAGREKMLTGVDNPPRRVPHDTGRAVAPDQCRPGLLLAPSLRHAAGDATNGT